jgi:hypothetical protein
LEATGTPSTSARETKEIMEGRAGFDNTGNAVEPRLQSPGSVLELVRSVFVPANPIFRTVNYIPSFLLVI